MTRIYDSRWFGFLEVSDCTRRPNAPFIQFAPGLEDQDTAHMWIGRLHFQFISRGRLVAQGGRYEAGLGWS